MANEKLKIACTKLCGTCPRLHQLCGACPRMGENG